VDDIALNVQVNNASVTVRFTPDRTPQASIVWKAKIRPMQAIDMKGEEP